jgi:hypothetical protein
MAHPSALVRPALLLGFFGLVTGVFAVACDPEARDYGSGGSPAATSSSGAGGMAGSGGAGGATSSTGTGGACSGVRACAGQIYECGDGIDNDSDGAIDADDDECVGACDNTEIGLDNALPGASSGTCLTDCYFDPSSGAGDDGCYWNYQCDSLEIPPAFYPQSQLGVACMYDPFANTPGTPSSCSELETTQSPQCADYCGPLVPNGCDCFGCCELPARSGQFVLMGSLDVNGVSTCTLGDAGDPSKCHPCTPVPVCLNTCAPCERCAGEKAAPAGCPVADQCPSGAQPCGAPGQDCCPDGSYCVTGCCQPMPM